MEKVPFTRDGLENLKIEYNNLKKIERPEIIKAISIAREHGDLSENAEYHAAKEKQSFIEGRISELEDVLSRAEIIDLSKLNGTKVTFGTTVKVFDEDLDEEVTYSIVGPYETDLEKKLISVTSPLARALLGKEVNSVVEVNTPRGIKVYEIIDIKVI
ncbi:MAG: transcription elongation factor GreA [SAR116 cluster bacterium]|nr:transcription elongation factor GreA [SAR116 cluster bacterium]